MNSLEQKYACQESKFLTTLGTTIYVASRTEKTKDCSDTFCGERGSFANPSLCLGEAFDLAESKSKGKDIKFAIEILTKEIVGSEETSAVLIPSSVISIAGAEEGTNVSGLDELILNHSVKIQNLLGLGTILKVEPESAELSNRKIKAEEFTDAGDEGEAIEEPEAKRNFDAVISSSQFKGLNVSIPEDYNAKLALDKVDVLQDQDGAGLPMSISAADGSNFRLQWVDGQLVATNGTFYCAPRTVLQIDMQNVDATLQGLSVGNTEGGNLILSRSNGVWNYTGEGEKVNVGCVECRNENECKNPDTSSKNCPCKRPCKIGSTTLSDDNMNFTAPKTVRAIEAVGGEFVKVERNNVKYLQNPNEEDGNVKYLRNANEEDDDNLLNTNIDSTRYIEDSERVEMNGKENINALGGTKGMIARNKYTDVGLLLSADGEGTILNIIHNRIGPARLLALNASNKAELNHISKDVNVGSREKPATVAYAATTGGKITTNQKGGIQNLSGINANIGSSSFFQQIRRNVEVLFVPGTGDAYAENYNQEPVDEGVEGTGGKISLTDRNVNIQTVAAFRNLSGKILEQILRNTNIKAAGMSTEMAQWATYVHPGGTFDEILRNVTFGVPEDLNKNADPAAWYSREVGEKAIATSNWLAVEAMVPNQKRKLSLREGATLKSSEQFVNYVDAGQEASLTPLASLDLQQIDGEETGDNSWLVGEGAILSRIKRGHKANTNGKPLDTYSLAPEAAANVSDSDGMYFVFTDSASKRNPDALLMKVEADSANFAYNSKGTQVKGQMREVAGERGKDLITLLFLSQVNATGASEIEWNENYVSKKLDGILDLKAIYTDDTKALHTKKLGDEVIENVDGAANDLFVSGRASLKKVLFGLQATMQSDDDFIANPIFVKPLTADNGLFALEAATSTFNVPVGKAFDFYGSGIRATFQGGQIAGDLSLTAPTFDSETEPVDFESGLSLLQLNGIQHNGKTFVSGPVKTIFSSGNTKGHVDARDGCILRFLNHRHEAPDPSEPLIRAYNAREIKKSVVTAVLRKVQSAIKASGHKPLSVGKDLAKLEPENDYGGVAYDYTEHKGPVNIAWGNLNADNVRDVIKGNPSNRPIVAFADSGTFLQGAGIENVVLKKLETAPEIRNAL